MIYESDSDAIRRAVPDFLRPDGSDQVFNEWINMPDSSGFGSYQESGVVIPCTFEGEPVNYTAQMYLNDELPISDGREIWGFPKRWGQPRLTVETDTLTGTLEYSGPIVAMGTVGYKHENLIQDPAKLDPNHYRQIFVHRVIAEEELNPLGASSKLNAEWAFLTHLHDIGCRAAAEWLDENFDALGYHSSVDVRSLFQDGSD